MKVESTLLNLLVVTANESHVDDEVHIGNLKKQGVVWEPYNLNLLMWA
jgi:hypothetical protein